MTEKNVSHYKKKGTKPKSVPGHRYFYVTLFTLLLAFFNLPSGQASDHGDTHLLQEIGRHDVRLTDLYAFVRNGNLVIALCSNPAISTSDVTASFSDDVTFRIHIDNDSKVHFKNHPNNVEFGGTVQSPTKIEEDITFTITFKNNNPILSVEGLSNIFPIPKLFAGLRDDPFIRIPRNGRNVAAIVLEFPSLLVYRQNPFLIWASSEFSGEVQESASVEHVGRALRSQFKQNLLLNIYHPKYHVAIPAIGVETPDVMICDPSKDSKFPNCRELTDDVVQYLVCKGFIDPIKHNFPVPGDLCCKGERPNDKAFLKGFPYLAEPHPKPKK